MKATQGEPILTEADRNEIDELYSVMPQNISVDRLHELSARVFSENMAALNNINSSNAIELKAHINYIKTRYNEYFFAIHDHIYRSCTDQKTVEVWIRMANDCQEKCDDMLGHIIRNALAKVMAEKQVELPTLSNSILYKKLHSQYFPTFSNTDEYKEHLLTATKNPIAPALPFYIAHIEDTTKREEDFMRMREMKQLLTDEEWKLITSSITGKNEGAIYAQIDRVLLNLGKSQHVHTLCDTFKEFNIDDHESLWRKFNKADTYFAEIKKNEPDPFIQKYKSAINLKVVRKIPAAPVMETIIPKININTAETKSHPKHSDELRNSQPKISYNFEEELRKAKEAKENFAATRQKSALSDSEIKEAVGINNQIAQAYIRQRNACEERCVGGEIPVNEYQLQASINIEIDRLKVDNAILRKKLFKPDEDKKDRKPTVLQAAVIHSKIISEPPKVELPREAVSTKINTENIDSLEKVLEKTNSNKPIYRRSLASLANDKKAETDQEMIKPEIMKSASENEIPIEKK
jgi:hypothetical protein